MADVDFLESLSNKIWATKNARFTAYKRMKRCNVSSVVATAMASADIILVNLLCYMKKGDSPLLNVENTTALSIMLSVLVLVLSLIVTLLNYSGKRDTYHNCGIELDGLNQRIKLREEDSKPITTEEEYDLLDEYGEVLQKYCLNHTTFDYEYALFLDERNKRSRVDNESDSFNRSRSELWKQVKMWIRWNIFDVNFLYWLIAIVPLLAILTFIGVKW